MRNILLFLFALTMVFWAGCEKNEVPLHSEHCDPIEKMIYTKTLAECFPEGAIDSAIERFARTIKERAAEVGRVIDDSILQWNSLGLDPQAYFHAANIILEDMERNRHQWLTMGNIFLSLGYPCLINEVHSFLYDKKENIHADAVQFELYYKNGLVLLQITSSGFLKSLFYKTEGAFVGRTPIHWPHDYSFASELPLVTGVSLDEKRQKTLLQYAEKAIGEEVEKEIPDCNFSIVLIDGISDNLVIIYFVLKGEFIRHHHMWIHSIDGGWQRLTEQEAISSVLRLSKPPYPSNNKIEGHGEF